MNIHSDTPLKNILCVGLFLFLPHNSLYADADSEKGYNIAARSDRSDRGFSDSVVEMTMILRNSAGKQASRTLQFKTLEIP